MKKKSRAQLDQSDQDAMNETTQNHDSPVDGHPSGASAAQDQSAVSQNPIDALESERDALMDQLLRARAEFDNFRKRVARENEALRQRAAEALVHDLLTVIDNLDLALVYKDKNPEALSEGVGMVVKQMHDILGRHGLAPIESEGKPFDPAVHEAVSQVPSGEVARDEIVQELQKGYMLGGRVLRPSKVTVSAGPAEPSQGGAD